MTEFAFPFPLLVCDTGGTNVRFALVTEPGAPLSEPVHLRTDDYPGLAEAIEAAAPRLGSRPRSAIACGAGPVAGRTLKLTNAPWVMDGPEAARRTGLAQGLLLNDFEAQALSPRWSRPTGASRRCRRRPAISTSARSGRKNSPSGRISNGRTGA
jgi:glucokinase